MSPRSLGSSGSARRPVSRRGLLRGSAAVGLGAAGLVAAGGAPAFAGEGTALPHVEFGGRHGAGISAAYRTALTNLVEINTVPYDPAEYNQTGLLTDPPGVFIRAGGGYAQPWTRDASVNSWNAGSLLTPDAARNTLWAVCRRQDDGTLIVQQDNQWWDQVIWTVAAWNHYEVTGDRAFLARAYETSVNTLAVQRARRLDARYGLYEGPAFMQDGIAGYPSPPYDPSNSSSFVLDHPGTDRIMTLSTNCVYHAAYTACARMADALGHHAEAARGRTRAAALRRAINTHLWREREGTYGYFLHGPGERYGQLEPYQEGNGLAFAILCGVASARQTRSVLRTTHQEPYGVVNVWPRFTRFDDAHPGRHNVILWPMTLGMWGHAAAVGGRGDLLGRAVTDLAGLAARDGHFWEIYNARTGDEDGGWQNGTRWGSEEDQTWSATGYLRLVHQGVFGLRPGADALRFAPCLPEGWGRASLTGLRWREATVDLTLTGAGRRVVSATVDGRRRDEVPADARGHHRVELRLA